MAINQKKAGVALSYVGEAVKILSGLLYTPILIRLLGQNEYGLYQLAYSVMSYLSLLSFGFGSSYVRFHARYLVKNDRDGIAKLNGMFMLVFGLLAGLCLLCGGVLVSNIEMIFGTGLTSSELEKAKILLIIMVVSVAINMPNSVYNCYITAHERFVFQKLLRVLQNVLNPMLALPLMLLGYDSVAVILVSAILTFAVFFSNLFYCNKALSIEFSYRGLKFSLLKEMWVFTFFIFLNQIIDQINWNIDKVLLGRYSGTVAVAIYGIGAHINTIYVQTSTAISNVFVPSINRSVAENKDERLIDLMTKVGRIQFFVLGLILSGFIFYGKPFIRFWAGEGYEESYIVALILIISITIPMIQSIGVEVQRAKNKHYVSSIIYFFIAVLNIVLSIWLIKRYGCTGAALGTAVSLVMGNVVFMNFYYHKYVGLNMFKFWIGIIRAIPSFVVPCIFSYLYTRFISIDSFINLVVAVLCYTIVYAVSIWLFGFNVEEKQIFSNGLSKLRKKR
ncbi:MAG: oligosaccharide flippase family protein [Ruminococcus sp.]|nr:oligosaccharide flippase family protein [Ruminococcus sp.]